MRGCEDARISVRTHEPKDMRMRMWGCNDRSKNTWTWGYEDASMPGYKLTLMNLRTLGCEDARIQASTHEPEDMSMQSCEQVHVNLG